MENHHYSRAFGGILLCFIALFCCPYSFAQPISINDDVDSLLEMLDKVVEQKADYRKARMKQIGQLKEQVRTVQGYNRINLYKEIFHLYTHFQTDSAQVCLDALQRLPEYANDSELQTFVHIGQAEIFAVAALYADALSELDRIDPAMVTLHHRNLLLYYLRMRRTLYGWMADYTKIPSLHKQCLAETMHYRDSLLALEPSNSVNRDVVAADKLVALNRPKEAIALLMPYAKRMDKAMPDPYICFTLAQAYMRNNEKDAALRCLILTSISDLKRATTEYQALPLLAQLLYERGDVKRAYNYLLCSMEDASYCKAGLRTIEASNIFPIINKRYKQQEAAQRRLDRIFLYSLIGLLTLLGATIVYLRKQMRKVRALRKVQATTNEQLSKANGKLQQSVRQMQETNEELQRTYAQLRMTDKMKEEYIARYLNRCRDYLDTLAEYRRTTLRLLKEHKIEELAKLSKSESALKAEQDSFYADFDTAFLTLFPNFIDHFNRLLQPGCGLEPKHNGQLNTELRIFALIRLGVTDTARIAHFLNFSLATVYNYRSKIRNKALGNPSAFEQQVAEIS